MTVRGRWVVSGAGLVLVVVLVAWYVVYGVTAGPEVVGERQPKTWTVQPGETLTLSADEVRPDDSYRCPGLTRIDFTPHAGTGFSDIHGFYVFTAEDGTVTASCQPGPPADP